MAEKKQITPKTTGKAANNNSAKKNGCEEKSGETPGSAESKARDKNNNCQKIICEKSSDKKGRKKDND